MPGMSGLELLNKIKSQFPQIQVRLISAYGDYENYQRTIGFGAKEFFTKPINVTSLKQEMQEMMDED